MLAAQTGMGERGKTILTGIIRMIRGHHWSGRRIASQIDQACLGHTRLVLDTPGFVSPAGRRKPEVPCPGAGFEASRDAGFSPPACEPIGAEHVAKVLDGEHFGAAYY